MLSYIYCMHLSIHWTIALESCFSQATVLEGFTPQYSMALYWRDASLNTLGYCIGGCIGGMDLTVH